MVVYLMRVIPAYFAAFTSNHRAVAPRWAMALFISSTDTFFAGFTEHAFELFNAVRYRYEFVTTGRDLNKLHSISGTHFQIITNFNWYRNLSFAGEGCCRHE